MSLRRILLKNSGGTLLAIAELELAGVPPAIDFRTDLYLHTMAPGSNQETQPAVPSFLKADPQALPDGVTADQVVTIEEHQIVEWAPDGERPETQAATRPADEGAETDEEAAVRKEAADKADADAKAQAEADATAKAEFLKTWSESTPEDREILRSSLSAEQLAWVAEADAA